MKAGQRRHTYIERGLPLRPWVWCGLVLCLLAGCGKQTDTIVSIALHPNNPQILYVSTNESVYKTRDGGTTWERMATDLSSYRILTLGIDPLHPATLYAGTMMDAVYKSPDGGQHWLPHNVGLKEHISVVNQFVFDPRDTDTIYTATTVGVFRTTDGGREWIERMAGMKEVHIVVTIANDPKDTHIFYAGTTGGAYRSVDRTATWVKINNGLIPDAILDAGLALGVNTLVVEPDHNSTVYAGTTKGLFKTVTRGDSWERIGTMMSDQYISALVIDPSNPNVLYVGGRGGIQKSTDGGDTWQSMNQGLQSLNIRTIAMSSLPPHTLFAGTNGSGLYKSSDGAQNWLPLPIVLSSNAQSSTRP